MSSMSTLNSIGAIAVGKATLGYGHDCGSTAVHLGELPEGLGPQLEWLVSRSQGRTSFAVAVAVSCDLCGILRVHALSAKLLGCRCLP